MKMIDPTAMSRFTALREAARENRPSGPPRPPHGAAAPRKPGYRLRGAGIPHAAGGPQLHHPAGAVLPVLSLRHRADGQDGARHLLHLHRFQDVGHGGRGMKRHSDIEKLSSNKRLAWRALSTLGAQIPLMDPALSVEEAPPATAMPAATVTVSIPNGHTLAKGPTVALGMLSNHADLLHSYCDEDGCICMEYILNLVWTESAPS